MYFSDSSLIKDRPNMQSALPQNHGLLLNIYLYTASQSLLIVQLLWISLLSIHILVQNLLLEISDFAPSHGYAPRMQSLSILVLNRIEFSDISREIPR